MLVYGECECFVMHMLYVCADLAHTAAAYSATE